MGCELGGEGRWLLQEIQEGRGRRKNLEGLGPVGEATTECGHLEAAVVSLPGVCDAEPALPLNLQQNPVVLINTLCTERQEAKDQKQ